MRQPMGRRSAVLDPNEMADPASGLSPAYAAALLRVARALKGSDPRSLDVFLGEVLAGLPIDPEVFKDFLQRNYSVVKATLGW